MSTLGPQDRHLHYSDGSHRWTAPPGGDQTAWEAGVHAHQEAHRAQLGDAPPTPSPRDHPSTAYPTRGAAVKRTIAGLSALAILAAGAVTAALAWEPSPPDCAVILRQAEQTSDAAVLVEEAGCTETTDGAGHDLTAQP